MTLSVPALQRKGEDSDEQTVAPRIVSRHRDVESEDDEELEGDVPRRRFQGDDGQDEGDDDEDAREARRAAVKAR